MQRQESQAHITKPSQNNWNEPKTPLQSEGNPTLPNLGQGCSQTSPVLLMGACIRHLPRSGRGGGQGPSFAKTKGGRVSQWIKKSLDRTSPGFPHSPRPGQETSPRAHPLGVRAHPAVTVHLLFLDQLDDWTTDSLVN